jgi:hypothetical protein
MFEAGKKHPRYTDLATVEENVRQLSLRDLTLIPNTVRREGNHRKIDMHCGDCGKVHAYYVDNLLAGKSKGCRCKQRAGKYRDPRSITLGRRYDAIVQRCERDTHVSSGNYKGRGIKNLLGSRETFVRWALARYVNTDFVKLDFDRENTDGHYAYDNLRLVSRSINLRNRRGSKSPPTQGEASDFVFRVRKRTRPASALAVSSAENPS